MPGRDPCAPRHLLPGLAGERFGGLDSRLHFRRFAGIERQRRDGCDPG
jgi:hypothetical protein